MPTIVRSMPEPDSPERFIMSLVQALGLKPSRKRLAAAEGDGARVQSTVTIRNDTGSQLRLLQSVLKFKTARFVPAAPASIAPNGRVTFQVVESTVGADRTEGSLTYHVVQRRHKIDVTFSWAFATADIKFDGDKVLNPRLEAVRDTEKGNTYFFNIVEHQEDEPGHVRVDVHNQSGFALALASADLEDAEHTEFSDPPVAQIDDTLIKTFFVQPLDEAHPEAAGTVVYRIDPPGKPPHSARMRWRKGATPVGTMEPNDGAFVVEAKAASDRFGFRVRKHDGPPPKPPGPMQITIVNRAGFTLTRDLLQLDAATARFKSEPAATIDGGRDTRFEVEAPNPEFPNKSGIVGYTFKLPPQDGGEETEHVIAMDWRSESPPSFARITPPADGVDVKVDGGNGESVVFTVTGPALEFNPPEKVKQPTLRKGDKSADGWVEYLQEALNHHLKAGLNVDGDFGDKTHKAVIKFQESHKKEGCMVDGIVGDQTWSFLREGVPEKPHTDGRKPHTFVEKGLEARWVREKTVVRFEAGEDALVMQAISVGDTDRVEGRMVRMRITDPRGTKKVLERPIGPGVPSSKTGQGFTHDVRVERFTTLFDESAKTPPPGEYTVEAFFDKELGGDKFSEVVTVVAR